MREGAREKEAFKEYSLILSLFFALYTFIVVTINIFISYYVKSNRGTLLLALHFLLIV